MEPDEDIRQPLRFRKGFAISTNDGYSVTTLWTRGSGARFLTPQAQSQKALTLALLWTPIPRHSDEDSQEPEDVRSKAGKG